MNENETQEMEKWGISRSDEAVYHYQKYHYRKLDDAIKFAKNDALAAQSSENSADTNRNTNK